MSKLGQGGFCPKVIGDSITFVPKPAPTLGFWLGERLGQGGFCRKVIGDSIAFVPKPAPTLGFWLGERLGRQMTNDNQTACSTIKPPCKKIFGTSRMLIIFSA